MAITLHGRYCAMLFAGGCCVLNLWQMLWAPCIVSQIEGHCSRYYCQCARWNGHTEWLFYFILCSEVLNRTSSHIWGRWYLPMLLFRDGWLTLMHIASFIVLMRFWSSLPTLPKFTIVIVWPVMQWSYAGKGAFRCSWTSLQVF